MPFKNKKEYNAYMRRYRAKKKIEKDELSQRVARLLEEEQAIINRSNRQTEYLWACILLQTEKGDAKN